MACMTPRSDPSALRTVLAPLGDSLPELADATCARIYRELDSYASISHDALTAEFGSRPVQVTSPQGRFAEAAALLDGQPLVGADSVGKHLLVDFDPGTVWIHLGLIGKFLFNSDFPAPNPATLRLRITDGLTAADLRSPQ